MARAREIVTVYGAGVIQGIGLVTFPAASGIFTDPNAYGLSRTEYGGMFIPQVVMAIVASLLSASLKGRLETKRIYLLGLSANLLAMSLLLVSPLALPSHSLAYAILLVATTSMGVGFGFTVPALNIFAAAFFPAEVDKAVLGMNALLGLGTALAPVLVAVFVALGTWWGLPLSVGVLLVGALFVSAAETLEEATLASPVRADRGKSAMPARFWVFAAFVLLYGVCETMNGNWASLYMQERLGANTALASLALMLFWSLVTAGRILFASLDHLLPEKLVCRILPFLVAAAFLGTALAPPNYSWPGLLAFALAGLGCSALLPLAISFGQQQLASMSGSVAGWMIAFYQVGYGLAAFGVGSLQARTRLDLHAIYGVTAVIALAMAALGFLITSSVRGLRQ